MNPDYHLERLVDPNDPRLEYIYRKLLDVYFLRAEIDPIRKTRQFIENTSKSTVNPYFLIVAFRSDSKEPVALLSGHAIEGGYGAIGYIATMKEHREKGIAAALLSAFEEQVCKHSRLPKLVITEGTQASGLFWDAVGYIKVQDGNKEVTYFQPPVDFESATGQPVQKEVKETLRFKILYKGKLRMKDLREWLIQAVDETSNVWYIPKREKFLSDEAFQNASKYARKIIESNVNNIRKSRRLNI
jgi:GNAT superfamily N-acetyltransferase